MLQQQAQAYLQPTNPDPAKMSPQDAQKDIVSNLAAYVKGGAEAPAARERIINIMAAQMQISHDEAAQRFDDAEAKLKQTRDQTVQTAKDAADASAACLLFRNDLPHDYEIVEMTETLLKRAMTLAETHGLRGYDAVQ